MQAAPAPAAPTIVDLELDEVLAGLRDGTILIVDVREPNEVAQGMIPGSVSMPLSTFDPAALPEPDGRRIVFSCAAGVRSKMAALASQKAGRDLREHFAGGFRAWLSAGEPVGPGPDPSVDVRQRT